MTERKCNYPIIVEKSNGRATCPNNLLAKFKAQEQCNRCPKAISSRLEGTVPYLPGEKAAIGLLAEQTRQSREYDWR